VSWIRTIPWDEATGELKEAYDWQAASLGAPAEFTTLGSLYPGIVAERLRLYRAVEHCPSALSPVERQVIAFVTSLLNGTAHCASGSRLKLGDLGATPALIDALDANPGNVRTGDARLDAICAHTAKLVLTPAEMSEADLDPLRTHGLDDLDIVDLNNIASYYCYINRVVMGLGLRTTMGSVHEATKALPT
jgi:uncharacterized peroxidase-related enzyme